MHKTMNNLSSKNSKKEIVSKYFKDKKQDNDESISEFQEPKNSIKGPKTAVNARQASTASKNKKPTKKIKGQKDIRAVLNKKNELVKYAKEFDQVCKISGIDVDPEQLQLAIALSKSLQETNSEESVSQKSKLLSAAERSGKIRTTLQEYGFKVPEVKLQTTGRRRLKGNRKHSKLLLISEAERQQIITAKYSQLVLENTTIVDESIGVTDLLYKKVPLYHIATNTFYRSIKHDETFYVDGLLEKSPNTIGSLLRDWSKIPGRPLSPVLQLNTKVKCCELDFDGLEINDILSGTIEKAQDIIKRKSELLNFHTDMDDKESTVNSGSPIKTKPNKNNALSITSSQYRCASPDLFDDEELEMLSQKSTKSENINSSPPCSQISSNTTRKKSNDFMDLTECINLITEPSTSKVVFPNVQVVEDCDQIGLPKLQNKCSNISQRKSNDFMEITNCIPTCGQIKPICEDNIDLTQGSDNETGDIDRTFKQHDKIESFDLTQSSNSNDTLPIVHISGTTRPVVEEVILPINSIVVLPKKSISPIKEKSIFEEYVFEHSDHSSKNNLKQSKSTDTSREANFTGTGEDTNVDLTQSSDSLDKMPVNDEFVAIPNVNILGKKDDISIDYDEVINDNNGTEETIESLSSPTKNKLNYNDVYDHNNTICNDLQHHSLVNKINHDDFHTYPSDMTANNIDQGEDSGKTNDGNKPPISDTPEVFEISDEELNYSIHKSKRLTDNSQESNEVSFGIPKGNFECGSSSILDNISGAKRVSDTITIERYSIRKSVNDSLPMVEIKGTKVKIKSPNKIMATDISTPVKDLVKDKFSFVNTPNNSEYVIKTNQVTPIVDYASLSTPERNKELDKYGLKPFKRKRAIQLLTHLYNQTHPVVETSTSEDLPSPSKKLKPNTENNQQKSPKDTVPPFRSSKSPRKPSNIDPCSEGDTAFSTSQKSKASANSIKENVPQKSDKMLTNADNEKGSISYEETSCVPVVKHVECSPDDWVFQKKERAKVHSCRVPLHIAFYNYVSSRRGVREAILRYDPVNIDVIHKDLIGYGHRYDPKDLLRFLDKKCITVKTADNNARNNNK